MKSLIVLAIFVILQDWYTAPTPQIKLTPSLTKMSDKLETVSDSLISVHNKKALFIGDSQTANHRFGWQVILCQKTGMILTNTAVVGKHLPWMISVARKTVSSAYDYCFIYGGANDIHGNRNPYLVAKDVQKIVNLCNENGVKAIVLTGFNAEECVKPIKGQEFYPKAFSRYQKILIDSITGAKVVDSRVVARTDCGDWTCHMQPSGHRKVAHAVINQLNFKVNAK
jgi:hypothetical protein